MSNMFKLNEAGWDRIVRVVLGLALVVAGFMGVIPGTLGVVAGGFGLVFLLTGLVGFCPLYALVNFSTKKA